MIETQVQTTGLAQDRMQLLNALLKKKGIRVPANQAIGTIAKRGGPGPWPLSFAQQRLWFLDQLEPGISAYNIPIAFRLKGTLNHAALEQSFQEILRRHESLRTSFNTSKLQPVQFVAPPATFELPVIDLTDVPFPEREAEARRRATADALAPFNLTTGPLVRISLMRLDDEDHVVTFTMHHIVSDGWSRGLVIREIATLYEAFCANRPSPLPELPVQYADYAVWQKEFLTGEVFDSHLSYWTEKLHDAPPVLNLPTDHPRPPVQTFNGASQPFQFPDGLSEKLQQLGAENNASLFMVLVGAFNALLSRYTSQEDIVVGTPVANRNKTELEGLIGFFINSLVLRTKLDGNPTFLELLARVREVTLGAYAHQELPFEKIVEALQPDRNLSHSPLYQIAFILENTPRSDVETQGLVLTPLRTEAVSSKFDLTLALAQFGSNLVGSVEYNTDLFERSTVERMITHYLTILEAVAADPELKLSELPLLTDEEWRHLVVECNKTETAADDVCVTQLFEEQVERSAQAIAVSYGRQQLTYEELDQRANQLAGFLRSLGVGPEAPVAICVDRCLEMVVAILGVLKAGGAYVPIDSSYPLERIAFIIGDAHAQILLTEQKLAESFATYDGRVVCLDSDWSRIAEFGTSKVATTVSPENLAYILYTSGSTGQPKGAMISHRGLVNYLQNWCVKAYEVDKGNGAPVHSSISFDLTITGLFGSLLAGKTVVLVPESERIEGLAEVLKTQPGFSLVKITPAHLELLSQQLTPQEASVATNGFVIGGEALTPHAISFWQENAPHTTLYNEYGPTEAVVGCCVYKVPSGATFEGPVPIGQPIPNTQLYILDRYLNPTAIGIPGEIYIGGIGLARGYLSRPQLTAERFIPDPFGDEQGARIYKTGDLARRLADGNVEYLGRIDRQLKIRGYRVEPGEVESVLSTHESVADAVVVPIDDGPVGKRLVAYVVFNTDAPDAMEQLRDSLRTKLPDYMVPSLFIPVLSIPLTTNGKVDLAALPPATQAMQISGREYVAPRTPVEEMLAGIWSEILKVERIGVNDNFFDLGGHSLLAAQVLSRLREVFKIDFPLIGLFEAPTVGELAGRIEKASATVEPLMLSAIEPATRNGDLPLSFVQQRLWFLDQLSSRSAAYNIPFPFRIAGLLDVKALERSIEDVIRRHEILRTVFPNIDGQPVQEIRPPAEFSIPIVDLSELPQEERERHARRLANEEIDRPFDVNRGPLMRAVLLRFGDDEHVIVVTFHHIIFDGWSMGLFLHEVSAHYEAHTTGRTAVVPELPIQYADFAYWQRERLLGSAMENQLKYWSQKLSGDLPVLELPTDKPRPQKPSFRGAHLRLSLPSELSESLKALSRKQGVTLFMTLLSAVQFLLQRYSGQDDIIVGSPIASRPRVETENLIGCFLNTLVLRTDLSGDPTFEELLERVREVTLGAYANQELPFEQVVDAIRTGRGSSQSSLFRVWFTYQNTPRSQGERISNLSLSTYDTDPDVAQFDLVLQIANADDGLSAILTYATDLFKRETVERMWRHFQTLLEGIVARPEARLSEFEMLSAAEKEEQKTAQDQRERLRRAKFKQARPKAINLAESKLVRTENIYPGESLPLVIKPEVPDVDLTNWVAGNREYVEAELTRVGGILFRGFQISSADDFERFVNTSFAHLLEYKERSTPRTEIGKYVYTSTEYPAEQSIALHNEFSYAMSWPMRICFFCSEAPLTGGETPIADCRKVYQYLDPQIRERFIEKKVMYARNYGSKIDLSWQTAFQTTDRAEVEEYCRKAPIDFEWLDGDRLRTRQVRESVATHPKTGEVVWFNQAHLFHMSNLEEDVRESLQATFEADELPRNAYYGDGSVISDDELDQVRKAFQKATVLFPWQHGDVLLLDNMLVAHGRTPYTGDRKILVAMANPKTR
ncbi:MAG TPA: amino acid adenylation domain-containing protein [Pyrinomonadaceae bacterium]|nr:amino acid adenylation domain-containing protein [Pyrinomonadaceae bacterium]